MWSVFAFHLTLVVALVPMMAADPDSGSRKSSVAEAWMSAVAPVPEFLPPRGVGEWEQRRIGLRSQLERLLGELPPRPSPVRPVLDSAEQREGYRLERFHFDNGAGDSVPGLLVIPNGVVRGAPAILYCHWHGGEYAVGKDELLRKDHTPEIPAQAFAARGYVVMAIDACCFGERNGHGPGGPGDQGASGESTASKFNLWAGRTLWGMIVRDDRMALDLLAARPEVDPARIGVTGISMGATRTWWLMALDERVRAGVAVACLTRYQDLIAAQALKNHGIYYFVPGMLRFFDTEAVVALSAPRPFLALTGDSDAGSPVSGVREIERRVRPVYEVLGAGQAFESRVYPGIGHVYTPEMWARMLAWMDANVKGQK